MGLPVATRVKVTVLVGICIHILSSRLCVPASQLVLCMVDKLLILCPFMDCSFVFIVLWKTRVEQLKL